MKNILLGLLLTTLFVPAISQVNKSYFISNDVILDESVPYPGEYTSHIFGHWHFSHDQLANYMKALSEISNRVKMVQYGKTFEGRPLFYLIITDGDKIKNIDIYKEQHKNWLTADDEVYNKSHPAIIWLGYSVHGNESSGGNAAMLTAYYLAAAKNKEVKNILQSSIIILDPCLNPDGFNRAASWVNMNSSIIDIADQNNMQFDEPWPGGRTNHYWFDLNRDWLLVQQPETKARLKHYHAWKPLVVTDHHEMGSNGTFFFQPGVPSRINPVTPIENYELTKLLGTYHAKSLDSIGSLYFSEENFDDFYYGKGSTYPDVNGAIGILFEQSRVNGQVINNIHGRTTFAEAIKNQFLVSLSTIKGTIENKEKFADYQKKFYSAYKKLDKNENNSGYIIGTKDDPYRLQKFIEVLEAHDINSYENNQPVFINNQKYDAGSVYVIPLRQPQYRLIKSIFEKTTLYNDSIFYDVSTWTLPLAFNLDYQKISNVLQLKGNEKTADTEINHSEIVPSNVGYLFEWKNYRAPALLYQLQKTGIMVKVATKKFQIPVDGEIKTFGYGTILIPTQKQPYNNHDLFTIVRTKADELEIQLFSIKTGLTKDIFIGSHSFMPVQKPEILMVAGEGISSRSAGEIWHLLDDRMQIPIVRIKPERLSRINLYDYNTIVLPDGSIEQSKDFLQRLRYWIKDGGTLICMGNSCRYLIQEKFVDIDYKKALPPDTSSRYNYAERRNRSGSTSVDGIILQASIDKSHPICYGYEQDELPVFRNNRLFVQKSRNPYSTPVYIDKNSILSGYFNPKMKSLVFESAYINIYRIGRGNIICYFDNPNFRAYWYGTNKLFLNGIFFGNIIRN